MLGQGLETSDRYDKLAVEVATLREALQRRDEALATLVHELRNPLSVVLGAAQLLPTGAEACDPEVSRARSLIERQARQMSRLVEELLEVTRLDRGTIALRPEIVDLGEAVKAAAEAVRPAIEARGHQLRVSLLTEPVGLSADPLRLHQILVNLLSNAARYTDSPGRIDLSAECRGDEVVLRVRDSGIGIAPEMLPRIFEPFVSAQAAGSPEGLGLGLAIVRRLVEGHGGRVEALSEGPGRGSEFVVALPGGQRKAVTRPGRVLVVEDCPDSTRVLSRLLERWGYEVEVAYDGPTAIEMAPEFRPDVVLLDIGLPGMDGFEVARRLRQDESLPGVRLVAMSGFGPDVEGDRAGFPVFDHHQVKPIDVESLRRLLQTQDLSSRAPSDVPEHRGDLGDPQPTIVLGTELTDVLAWSPGPLVRSYETGSVRLLRSNGSHQSAILAGLPCS